jgi:membrane-associated protease RseP (regulator of RpoE activity)
MTMLSQTPVPVSPRWPSRRSLGAAGGLLTLAVFITSASLAVPLSAQQEDTKKKEPKKDKTTQEEAKQNRPQPGFPPRPPGGGAMPPGFIWPGRDARLGVRVDPPSDAMAEQLDLPKGQGLVVQEVVPDSAAAKAGIRLHDVLLEVDGKTVANRADELARMIANIKPDTAVDVVVMRKGKKETIKDVKLPEAKAAPLSFPPGGAFPGGQPPAGFRQTQPGFQQQPPFGIGGMASVVTTMTRTQDRFTLRHQEGSLIITLTGQTADGKPKIKEISVQDGLRSEQYESVDKVPERYRDKVQNLIEMSEKGSTRIDIKSR